MAGLNLCLDVYIKRLTGNTTDSGLWVAGNLVTMTLGDSSESTKRQSRRYGTCGQTLDTFATGQGATLTVGTDELEYRRMMALLLRGDDSSFSQSETPVTNESHTAHIVDGEGQWVKLAYHPVKAASVTVTDDPDTTPGWVEGTDYEVNYNLGLIRPIAGGAISDGDAILVDYTYTAVSGSWEIVGGTNSVVKCELWGIGKNKVTGNDIIIHVPRVAFSGDVSLELLGDDFATGEVTGDIELNSTVGYAYKVQLINLTA